MSDLYRQKSKSYQTNRLLERPQRATINTVGGDIHKLGSYHKSSRTTDLRLPPLIIYTLLLEAYVLAHPFLIGPHFLFWVIRKCRCGNASALRLNLSSRLNHYFTITATTYTLIDILRVIKIDSLIEKCIYYLLTNKKF